MLTDAAIKTIKIGTSPKKVPDIKGRGLYLLVTPEGGKLWRYRFTFEGREQTLPLGKWPDVLVEIARERLQAARTQVALGINPCAVKRAKKQSSDLKTVTELWLAMFYPTMSDNRARIVARLTNYIYPTLGARPMASIEAKEVLACLEVMVEVGRVDAAHRCLGELLRIWTWACLKDYAKINVIAFLKGQLPSAKRRKFPGLTDPARVGKLLRDIDTYRGQPETRACLQLLPYVATRPSEFREAVWEEFDLANAIWRIPAERMKERRAHAVPLPRQVIVRLRKLQVLSGTSGYLFPGKQRRNQYARNRPISDGTINKALRQLGYNTFTEQSGHGFRTTFSTMTREELGENFFSKEAQLSHATGGVAGKYDEATELKARRPMMQRWADYLDKLRTLPEGSHSRPAMQADMNSSMSDSSQRTA